MSEGPSAKVLPVPHTLAHALSCLTIDNHVALTVSMIVGIFVNVNLPESSCP